MSSLGHSDLRPQTVNSQGYSEFDFREPIKFLSDVWVYLSRGLSPV